MVLRYLSCFLILLCLAGSSLAQTSTGTVKGTVVDGSGAPVPGAAIELQDAATGLKRMQHSTNDGVFEFALVPPGAYGISVEKQGFHRETIQGISLQVAEIRDVRLQLAVGEVTESVTITADTGTVQTAEASLSQVIDEKRVSQLPINGRNVLQLIGLAPGVNIAGRASAAQRQANYGPSFTMGGQRDNTSIILVDGIEISGMEVNNYPLAVPSLESVTEFRVVTANASAEFGGNSGAIVNIASKRGTNDIHGTLFEFLRNDALDARNFFSIAKSPLKRNQFGGVVSGPVLIPKLYKGRDRTFWMFSYEGTRQSNAIANTAVVPAPSIRSGDFSGVGAAGLQIVDPYTKTPFPGNIIPASRISSFGKAYAALYPLPNASDPARNFYAQSAHHAENDLIATRVDHRITNANTLFGRVTLNNPYDRSPGQSGVFTGFDSIQTDGNVQTVVGDTHVFSPTVINELNLGFVRFNRDRTSQDAFKRNWLKDLGIQGIPSDNGLTWGAPLVAITGYTSIGYSTANSYLHWVSQSAQVVDNVTVVRGKHTLKAGATFNAKRNSSTQWLTPNGSYSFTGVYTAPPPVSATNQYQAFADLLLGVPASYSAQVTPYLVRLQNKLFFAYVQDDWRVTPNLTINAGVRWEYYGKPEDRYARSASFDLNTGKQIFYGQPGVQEGFVHPDYNNFGPRLGLAWRPFGWKGTSVRAAYGLFYSPEVANSFVNLGFQDPFVTQYNRVYRDSGINPIPAYTATDPLANSSVQVVNNWRGVDPNFRDAYIGDWNLSIQQQVAHDTVVEVAYRGSKSTRLSSFLNYNETIPFPAQPPNFVQNFPYPALGTVNMLESRGAGTYNALQARVEKRYSKGLTVLGSYVWSKALTDIDASTVGVVGGTGNASVPQTIRNLHLNKGPAVFDRPQRLVISGIYDLPFPKDHNTLLSRVAGGWQIGGTGNFGTGYYLTPASYSILNAGSRASYIGNPNLPSSERTTDRWYDTSKVVNPAVGTLGNAGKGTILGSGLDHLDLVLNKSFYIDEVRRFELRAEFFNAFNKTQFDDPILGPGVNPQAGKITSASDYGNTQTERVIQLALKFQF